MTGLPLNIVLNVRSEFLTYTKAIGRLGHIAREIDQTKHIDYLRASPNSNRYKVLSEYNGNGHMREANGKDDEIHNKEYLKNLLSQWQDKFEIDYNAQTYMSKHKSGKVLAKHKKWRSDMVGFNEIIITFGTDRVKEKNEGLNVAETQLINTKISFDRVERFINAYCAKNGVKCLLIAEHNDEKTKHYQVMLTNYNFEKHANIRYDGKKAASKAGKELQDMGAKAFDGQAMRGKPSSDKHKSLSQMQETEIIYKDEQELKADIKIEISKLIAGLVNEQNPLIGEKFYKLTPGNKAKLISELTMGIFELAQRNINIISDETLKEQVEILSSKIIKQDGDIRRIKDLEEKLEQLKNNQILLDENTRLVAKTNKQSQEIEAMTKRLEQAVSNENELKKLQRMKSAYENSITTSKQKDDIIDELNTKLKTYNEQSKTIEALEQKVAQIQPLKDNNQRLESENSQLKNENSTLKAFNAKVAKFVIKLASKFPKIVEFIKNELPEIQIKNNTEMEMTR